MAVGMRAYNDSGVLQFDDNTPNFQLRQSGSGTCNTSQSSGGRTRYYTQITVTNCTSPMIALGNCSTRVCVYNISVSGSTWTFTIMSNTNGATFNYYVFDQGVSVSGNVGMRFFTAAGNLAYQTNGKPLRIVGSSAGTYTSGRTYAVIQTSNGWSYTNTDIFADGNIDYLATLGAFTVASNVISDAGFTYESYSYTGTPGYNDSYTDPNYALLVIDVTNY